MIEIGAGGGSIASVDALGRIQTGPESAGSEPGPACYGRGGSRPTITDADLVLGKIDARNFAGGAIVLDVGAAEKAIHREVGSRLELKMEAAAFGISEVVDENMANAARVHAVENGKNISDNVMIAFGGAAPLHAARLCEKLGVARCLIPRGAGVGSAIGFLKAPFGFEAVASKLTRMSEFDAAGANVLLAHLRDTAERFVRSGSTGTLHKEITAFMRYSGQGWEIPVLMPERAFGSDDAKFIVDAFRECYARFFGRPIDGLEGLEIEIVTWSVKVQDARPPTARHELLPGGRVVESAATRPIFDPASGRMLVSSVFSREDLVANDRIHGPAVIVESETATIVSSLFDAVMQSEGSILLVAKESRS
jgi:N-methylhydantoinase A